MKTTQQFYVPIDRIRVNHKKLRKLSQAKIMQYARQYECGADFPPIRVDCCGDFYVIRDGRHRYQAQLCAGYAMVEIDLS